MQAEQQKDVATDSSSRTFTGEEVKAMDALERAKAALVAADDILKQTLEPLARVEAQRDAHAQHPIPSAIQAREDLARALARVNMLLVTGLVPLPESYAMADDFRMHARLAAERELPRLGAYNGPAGRIAGIRG